MQYLNRLVLGGVYAIIGLTTPFILFVTALLVHSHYPSHDVMRLVGMGIVIFLLCWVSCIVAWFQAPTKWLYSLLGKDQPPAWIDEVYDE